MTDICGDFTIFNNQTRRAVIVALYSFQSSYMSIHGYMASIICIFGIITNLIHIFVLTHKSMRHSAVHFVMAMVGLCDLGTMGSYLTYLIQFVIFNNKSCIGFASSYYWMYFAMAHVFLSVYLHTLSIWLIVVMSFMRLMTLRLPTLNSPWQSVQRARKLTLLVAVVIFTFCTPTFLMHKIKTANLPEGYCLKDNNENIIGISNKTVNYYYAYLSAAAVESGCFLLKTQLAVVGLIFKLLPCALLATLSSMLISAVHHRRFPRNPRRCNRQPLQANNCYPINGPDSTTLVLLAILLIFLLTELPQGILAIGGAIFTREIYFYVYRGMADLLDLLSLINSSVNFLIYCLMSSEYRSAFREAIFPQRNTSENDNYEMAESSDDVTRTKQRRTGNRTDNYFSVDVENSENL